MKSCFDCGKKIERSGKPGRGDTCEHCRADLRVCKNCRFYDEAASNECLEPQAERVAHKERANFCDYFVFREESGAYSCTGMDEAQRRLEALFQKN